MNDIEKLVKFCGSSLNDLRNFPDLARKDAGYQLGKLQEGDLPADWKSMKSVGAGVYEIRIKKKGSFRVIYVTRFEAAIYVLHCFQKKTQKTAETDIELAKQRYQNLIKEQKE
jgi:phage-related protein